jgi:hypothetical protein
MTERSGALVCMTTRMQKTRFPAPGEDGATVRVPLRFDASDA